MTLYGKADLLADSRALSRVDTPETFDADAARQRIGKAVFGEDLRRRSQARDLGSRFEFTDDELFVVLYCVDDAYDRGIRRSTLLDAAIVDGMFGKCFDPVSASVGSWLEDYRPEVGYNFLRFAVLPDDISTGEEMDWFRFLVFKYGAVFGAEQYYSGDAWDDDIEQAESRYSLDDEGINGLRRFRGTRLMPREDITGLPWPDFRIRPGS